MSRHDHFLALIMGLKPGMRGLDCGCGTGGPSREIALFSDTHITGISINQIHIDRATAYAKNQGLSHLLDYKVGDFMVSCSEVDFSHLSTYAYTKTHTNGGLGNSLPGQLL